MEEKVLIKSCLSQSVKFIFKCIIIACASISILCLLFGIISSINDKSKWKETALVQLEESYQTYGDHAGEYRCEYLYSSDIRCQCYFDTVDEYFSHIEFRDHYSYWTIYPYHPSRRFNAWYILHWAFIGVAGIFYLSWFLLAKCRLTITDKNVYGTTPLGKKVSLPLDMISAHSTSKFLSRITITTASGTTRFSCIGNYNEIAIILQQLINERQEKTTVKETVVAQQNTTNNLDELAKLKTLLDGGIITQEEFDKKKKQLLEL